MSGPGAFPGFLKRSASFISRKVGRLTSNAGQGFGEGRRWSSGVVKKALEVVFPAVQTEFRISKYGGSVRVLKACHY